MASLHTNRGRLPDDRADLYNDSVDLLMLHWNEHIGAHTALLDGWSVPGLKLSGLREVLEELAFRVHEENVVRRRLLRPGGRPKARRTSARAVCVRAFRPLLGDSRDKAAVVVDYIEKRAGLLIGQGEKHGEPQFTFPHRTFQEFLAACYLAGAAGISTRRASAWPGQHLEHWQEVLRAGRPAGQVRPRCFFAADAMIGGGRVRPRELFRHRQPTSPAPWSRTEQLLEIGLADLRAANRTSAIA